MKTTEFKKIIKESVREVFQEELKNILLEALKSPQQIIKENSGDYLLNPTYTTSTPQQDGDESSIRENIRRMYMNSMNENITSNNISSPSTFIPRPVNTVGEGSSLPEGEVGLDQIQKLMTGGL
jgi:hypothetical protein